MNTWFHSFWSLLFPRCCVVCGSPLSRGEECLCTCCNINLPRTGFHLRKDNPVECLFWGRIPGLKRASSFLFYRKGSDFRRILHLLKYGGYKELGEVMGRYMSAELSSGEFFDGVDMIIPVPLHRKKQKLRGYNQSEWIARGIASVTCIPLCAECMIREKNTETQTRKSTFERWENVEGIFRLCDTVHFEGKHVLLVDDVLTTGATTVACASAFAGVSGIRISVLTLAVAE